MTNKKYLFIILIFISFNIQLFSQETGEAPAEIENIEKTFKIRDTIADAVTAPAVNDGQGLVTFTFWDFLRMLLVFLLVIASIYGLIFFLKKMGTGKYEESDLINILSSKSVAAGKSLHIVEVGNQMMLLGVSDDSINLITEIKDKETFDTIKLHKGEQGNVSGGSFYSYLSQLINPGKSKSKKGKKTRDIGNLLNEQKKRMEKL
jgi:flagellar protein FliO/FliZ